MKGLAIFFLLIIIVSCHQDKLSKASIVYEGVGVDRLTLDNLDEKKVTDYLGQEFDTIYHLGYSTEMFYKNYGVSFYFLLADTTHKIFAISFNKDFKGSTKKGLKPGTMNVGDMVKIYGEPRWQLLTEPDMLYAHY